MDGRGRRCDGPPAPEAREAREERGLAGAGGTHGSGAAVSAHHDCSWFLVFVFVLVFLGEIVVVPTFFVLLEDVEVDGDESMRGRGVVGELYRLWILHASLFPIMF